MKLLVQTFTDPTVRSNNLRALGIHAFLSVSGFAVFALFVMVLNGGLMGEGPEWSGLVGGLVTVAAGIPLYVYFGYYFLENSEKKAILSVAWVFALTVLSGIIMAAGPLAASFEHLLSLPPGSSVQEYLILVAFPLNILGLGIAALLSNIAWPFLLRLEPLIYLLTSFAPSGFLYLGLRLKMKRNAGEKNSEVSEARVHD